MPIVHPSSFAGFLSNIHPLSHYFPEVVAPRVILPSWLEGTLNVGFGGLGFGKKPYGLGGGVRKGPPKYACLVRDFDAVLTTIL